MLCKIQSKKLHRHLLVGGVLCAAAFGAYSCTDKYELDTKQPDGLNSIYGYLQEQGNYKTCLQLIDDLGETEVLSKTGSKTMFVANDDAFKKFFSSNSWGVSSYSDLTVAQKKILLYSAMIDNPYSTSMLSTAEGPVKGVVCRRSSSLTKFDSVLVVDSKSAYADEVFPKEGSNYRFDDVRKTYDNIVMFNDASTSAPLVHFNYKFLAGNRLASTDVDFLYNQPANTRQNDDVYINNAKVFEPNIFCKNGFIHKVDEVVVPLDNMSEIIRKDPETSIWSSIVERFACPYYDRTLTDTYNQLMGTDYSRVFNKRYFSDRSGDVNGKIGPFTVDENGKAFEASLKFDPGWNGYALEKNGRDAMQEDMAVMMVPTDEAFKDWWENGAGSDIKEFYKTLENTPTSVLQRLVNVNQLESMVASLPSRFTDILDDANDCMGVTEADISKVTLGCNGVVYKTNKVFSPKAYSSVLFPVVVDTTNLRIIETAVSCMDYSAYLNSMVSDYIFLVPTNKGLLTYIDPVSYGQKKSKLWEFKIGSESKAKHLRIAADVYDCVYNESTKEWEKVGSPKEVKDQDIRYINENQALVAETQLRNRLEKLLDNIIVTTGYENGKQFYRTKGNTYVRIESIEEGGKVYGSLQSKLDKPLTILKKYKKENGYALLLDGPIMGTNDNVASVLKDKSEFSEFFDLLSVCGALFSKDDVNKWAAGSSDEECGNLLDIKTYGDIGAESKPSSVTGNKKVTYILNNYHYTMFVPTNKAMEAAYKAGLPTLEMINAADVAAEDSLAEEEDVLEAQRLREVVLDFVKYHIFDNSAFVDKGFKSGDYESQKTELIFATKIIEDPALYELNATGDSVLNGSTMYAVKSWPDASSGVKNGEGSVEVYTGKYTSGKPYKVSINVSESGMTVTDNIGNVHNVVTTNGLYNLQAEEIWISSENATGTSKKVMDESDDPFNFYLNNGSSVVVHAIDGPLIYADGEHYNANNDKVPTQFVYKYKPLSVEARTRK